MRVLVLTLLGLGFWLNAPAQEPTPEKPQPIAERVTNADGEVLANPRLRRFDGLRFEIEHDLGISTIDWQRMPEAVRQRFPLDPGKAQTLERQQAERRAALATQAARAAAAPQPGATPSPTPLPAAPEVIRREMRLGDLYILSTIGGPAGDLKITNVTQTEVSFSRYKFGSETRELKLGFGEPRTLLFSVLGCDVYFVNVRDRPRYHAVVEFEYAPGKAPVER